MCTPVVSFSFLHSLVFHNNTKVLLHKKNIHCSVATFTDRIYTAVSHCVCFWEGSDTKRRKKSVGRKYGSADNAGIKLYPCFIVLQWQ